MGPDKVRKVPSALAERDWPLDPEAWTHITDVLMFLVQLILDIIRLIALIRAVFLSCVPDTGTPAPHDARAKLYKPGRERGHECRNQLAKWQALPPARNGLPSVCYDYPTRLDRLESVQITCVYMGFCRHIAARVRDGGDARSALELKRAVRSIRVRALQSTKFRESFKNMIRFIEDLEASSLVEISEFLEMVALDMLGRKSSWHLQFLRTHLRGGIVPKDTYEATLAVLSVFHRGRRY